MSGPNLTILSLSRQSRGSAREETLEFAPGVNVIVGPHNSGKTKWLTMLDYLFGDRDSPEQALGDLANKFVSVKSQCQIGEDKLTLERRWSEPGEHSKIWVDGRMHTVSDVYSVLMERLRIPIVHYPSGDPLGPRAWPELNFRSLFRHIYRQQKYWTEIADRQPYPEQHACLLQFLGAAEAVFSAANSQLAAAQKHIADLQLRKEQYLQILDDVSKALLRDERLGGVLSEERIATASAEIQRQVADLTAERTNLLKNLRANGELTEGQGETEALGKELVGVRDRLASSQKRLNKTQERLGEIREYRESLQSENGRLDRALAGSEVLSSLRVTHCPECDRELPPVAADNSQCYVCKRPTEDRRTSETTAANRVKFEKQRLESEIAESEQLIETLETEEQAQRNEIGSLSRQLERLNSLLAPVRRLSAALIPPELSITDMRIGELRQRQRQLDGLREALNKRLLLSKQIDEIHSQISILEARVSEQAAKANFDQPSDWLADAMNDYLHKLRAANPRSWTSGRVTLRADARTFQFFVDAKRWSSKLGGTLSLYFFIAYHYGLLQLTHRPGCHYPGLLILDLPAELEDSESIADRENFILLPFIAATKNQTHLQVIVAGSSFEQLKNVNRLELRTIWK